MSLPWFPEQFENEANFLFSFVRKHSKKTKNDWSPGHLQDHAQVVNSQPIGRKKERKKERQGRTKKKERKKQAGGSRGAAAPLCCGQNTLQRVTGKLILKNKQAHNLISWGVFSTYYRLSNYVCHKHKLKQTYQIQLVSQAHQFHKKWHVH